MSTNSPETRSTNLAPQALTADEVFAALDADINGLNSAEAATRLERFGQNKLPEPPKKNPLLRFLVHFNDILIYILLAASVLKAILGEWVDFFVILAVALINALVGFIQEGRAEQALQGIRNMLSLSAKVKRDGSWVEVDAADLVPGDIVRLKPGDKVPADLRLFEATNLTAEESALTGESVPTEKTTEPVEADAGVGDQESMLFSGALIATGQGRGVVTSTGGDTEIGKIQSMIAQVEKVETPLTRQLGAFGTRLSLMILGMAGVMLIIGRLLHNFETDELIAAAIGFSVAAIPEGLPALVTITLALGVQQMARRNAITRKLPAVEALGSVSTICSDKTGTLTKNEMTVRTVVTTAASYAVSGIGYQPKGEISLDGSVIDARDHADLFDLVQTMATCNDSHLVETDGLWQVLGEPTEGALRTLGGKASFSRKGYDRVASIPFDSINKFMAVLSALPTQTDQLIMIKGASDRLLDRSSHQRSPNGETEPLNREFWEQKVEILSAQGLRVLAAARKVPMPDQRELALTDIDSGLVFLGVVGIVDPPRPEAITAIAQCRAAGIRVKMITGDHAGTAHAISKEMGITDGDNARVITGSELHQMSQSKLRKVVREVDVYARTSPEHKLRIVSALQSHGEVVAMTGDGVNDAPALTRADIGVAMGIKGTEATKEAAEIVLADDNFATIERAVKEGRRIYDNLRKSVIFLLPTNGAQSLVILVAILLGFTLPLDPVQILWVNMVTAVTLSLALAYEPAEQDVMRRPPRNPKAGIIEPKLLLHIGYVSLVIGGATLVAYFTDRFFGASLETAQTTAVTMLALGQLVYLLNCRYITSSSLKFSVLLGNRAIWFSAVALLLLQVLFIYAPFMHTWFGSAAISLREWALTLGLAVMVFLLVELGKAALRLWERHTVV